MAQATMMIFRTIRASFLVAILWMGTVAANSAAAQSVRIQNGLGQWGHGWMFRHAGNCFAALPAHVAGPLPKVTISSAAPVETDQATVLTPFWPGIDLAIAVIDRGALNARCVGTLDDLNPTASARAAERAFVLRLTPLGEEKRVPIRVLDRDYLRFTGEVVQEDDVIMQGTSGAFAFVDGRPIGMALTSDDPTRVTFMRAEEVALNLSRYLAEQGRAFAPTPASADAPIAEGLPMHDLRANVAAVLPQHGIDNLLGDEGAWVVRPNGPVELTFRVGDGAATAVSQLRMTAPADGPYAVPKAVAIYLDAGERGDRFRYWTGGEMRPDGVFDTGPLAGRNARWVRVRIVSAWEDGEMALDRVVLD